jgi:hypothetical protein
LSPPGETSRTEKNKPLQIAVSRNGDKPAPGVEQRVAGLTKNVPGDHEGTQMRFLQLLSPCLFQHGDKLRTRDDNGHLVLQCADCGEVTRLLEQPVIRGPKHHLETVKGAPIVKVKRFGTRHSQYPRIA